MDIPPRFPNGAPTEKDKPISSAFFFTSPDNSPFPQSPQYGSPRPCSPNWVPMERDAPSPEPMVYSFIYSCQSPQLRNPPTKWGKNICSPSPELHVERKPTYNGVWPGPPRELFTTLLSLPQCHAAFSTIPSTLAWVDQCPVSQCVSQ